MLVLVVLFVFGVIKENVGDTYLEALEESRGTTEKMDREYSEQYPYPPSQSGYSPSQPGFSPSQPGYPPSQPGPQYGPPKYSSQYGPPAAPIHNYGPPLVPVYGPPVHPQPVYGMPHGMLSFFDKLKFKLDLFTVGKILLKIFLFKKFVSFVGILCLLLFIPYLKQKVDEGVPSGDDEEDETAKGMKKEDQILDNMTQFVIGAIDSFSKNYTVNGKCEDFYCKTQKIMKGIDNKLSYRRLAEVYSREIQP